MKRITFSLPDETAVLLDAERRRRDVSAATVIREAVEKYLAEPAKPRTLRIAALGASGFTDTSERTEEILHEQLGGERGYRALMFGEDSDTDVSEIRPEPVSADFDGEKETWIATAKGSA
jgi:Ribbon-helix-helix protein, copG family